MENSERSFNPLVSVIIPICGEDIQRLITLIKSGTYKNIEIIVIDQGKERSEQRNFGIDQAKGEYLLILDSDQYPHPKLIENCVLLSGKASSIYIPERIVTPGFFGRLRDWERQFYTATAIDCVRFVKKTFCPYFCESMSGPEDSDWDRRILGPRTISSYPLYHYDKIGFIKYLKKKAYYSKSMAMFHVKHPKDKVLNPFWRCFGVFFENGKWRKFLAKPHYAISILIVIFIRGVVYLWKK